MDPQERLLQIVKDNINQLNNLSGIYRAKVVDTNDPLHIRRVKIRIPMFHDDDILDENNNSTGTPDKLCPWALVINSWGGNGSGQWHNYCIGDVVFITFENGNPYNPVVIGPADPTLINLQPLESEYHDFQVLSKDLNVTARKDKELSDHYKKFYYANISDYIPKDRRPMNLGFKDRYGSFFIMNSTGFFPTEHNKEPQDDYIKTVFEKNKKSQKPLVNQPDSKFIALVSKYGNYLLLADQGYYWKNDPQSDPSKGEFEGNLWKDYKFETSRSLNLLKTFNEDTSDNKDTANDVGNLETHDQRRIELRTRYGHMIQMRDVGWIKTRKNEYSEDSKIISEDNNNKQLWLKLKTKGGHLIEMIDNGFNLEEDEVINTPHQKENQCTIDEEYKFGDDARMIRLITRGLSEWGNGSKIVLDDRIQTPSQYNRGILLKTSRRSLSEIGLDPFNIIKRGFGIELNDIANHMQFYSPEKQCIEFNDDKQTLSLATGLKINPSIPYKGKSDNEFNDSHIDVNGSFYIKLDNLYKKISIKTPNENKIELKDDDDEKYISIEDDKTRGIYISSTDKIIGIKNNKEDKYIVIDDDQSTIIIYSANKIKIYSEDDIEFYSKGNIKFKSEKSIIFTSEMTSMEMRKDIISTHDLKKGTPQSAKKPEFNKPKLKPGDNDDN